MISIREDRQTDRSDFIDYQLLFFEKWWKDRYICLESSPYLISDRILAKSSQDETVNHRHLYRSGPPHHSDWMA